MNSQVEHKILVTGGFDQIGISVLSILLERGFTVLVYDSTQQDNEWKNEQKRRLEGLYPFQFVYYNGEAFDPWALRRILLQQQPNVLIDPGGTQNYYNRLKFDSKQNRKMISATASLLEVAKKMSSVKVIYLSSSLMYRYAKEPCLESSIRPDDPNLYLQFERDLSFVSELTREQMVLGSGLDVLVFRTFNPYSEYQIFDESSISIPSMMVRSAINQVEMEIPLRPDEELSMIHGEDLGESIVKGIESSSTGVFNLASVERVCIEELASIVEETVQQPAQLQYTTDDNRSSLYAETKLPSTQKMRSVLKSFPSIGFQDGIRKIYEFYAEQSLESQIDPSSTA